MGCRETETRVSGELFIKLTLHWVYCVVESDHEPATVWLRVTVHDGTGFEGELPVVVEVDGLTAGWPVEVEAEVE